MTDEERADSSNGIWLCRTCAKMIDSDEVAFPVPVLVEWKDRRERESGVASPTPVGRIIEQVGPGVGVDIEHVGTGPAEEIEVEGGPAIGEIVTSTGGGTGKKIRSIGGTASKVTVKVTEPVENASALWASTVFHRCSSCSHQFSARVMISGVIGTVPTVEIECPRCGARSQIKLPL